MLLHWNSLDVKKSTGTDGLSAKFLKEITDVIAAPFATLFNSSLQQSGVVPAVCKRSNIIAVHMGRALADPDNSKLISIVPVLAKVLKKLYLSSLVPFGSKTMHFMPIRFAWVNQLKILAACC